MRPALRISAELPEFVEDIAVVDRLQLLDPPLHQSDILQDGEGQPDRSSRNWGRCDRVVKTGANGLKSVAGLFCRC